jgi:integrase
MFRRVPHCSVVSTSNGLEVASLEDLGVGDTEGIAAHDGSEVNQKSGKQVANQNGRSAAKNDSRYWLPRIFKPVNDRGDASPHYSMRVAFKGRRMAFSLGTGNKDAGARKARDIYGDLLTLGTDATLAKHRAQKPEKPEAIATVGEWIAAAKRVFDGSPATFGSYTRCLRSIGADILKVAKTKKRFARASAGAYRRQIDSASLAMFSAEALQAWRIRFVQRAGANPAKQRSARISCNSMLRQARALFSKKILKFMSGLNSPEPLPFTAVDFYPRESMRYQSKIDPAVLLQAASAELAVSDSEAFKALLLALGAGLRRGEIDRLLWRQVNFDVGVIHIETTEAGGLKSEDSAGGVPIDPALVALLRGYRAKTKGLFVIEGGVNGAGPRAWGQRYRCDDVFVRLMAWLRGKGVEGAKPLHTLRKEAGSIVATKAGIYAASRFLRHADIQVTSQHYADHKERVTVELGMFLQPANAIPFATEEEGKTVRESAAVRSRKAAQ